MPARRGRFNRDRDANAGNVRVALTPAGSGEVLTSLWAKPDKSDSNVLTLITDHPGDIQPEVGWKATVSGEDFSVAAVDGLTLTLEGGE
jgi:hypothetical protein